MSNQQDLLNQLTQNKAALLQIMQSPEGQRLIALLTKAQGSNSLKQAAGAAASGNTAQLSAMIAALMRDPEGAKLVERINNSMKK